MLMFKVDMISSGTSLRLEVLAVNLTMAVTLIFHCLLTLEIMND